MSFIERDTQRVVAVIKIWRQYINESGKVEFKPIFEFYPYYKAWISEDVDFNLTGWKKKVGKVVVNLDKFGGTLLGGKKISNKFLEFMLDPTNRNAVDVLGIQIDTTCKFGARAEIAFADQDGLMYNFIRTNDLIFVWLLDLNEIDFFRNIGMAGTSIDKVKLAAFYEGSDYFEVDWSKIINSSDLNDVYINPSLLLLSNERDLYSRIINIRDKLRGVETNNKRLLPTFAGFITVKRRHVAKSRQFRILCQDPIRYFQHYKFDLSADEGMEFMDTSFYKEIFEPVMMEFYKTIPTSMVHRATSLTDFYNKNKSTYYESELYAQSNPSSSFQKIGNITLLKLDAKEIFQALITYMVSVSVSQKFSITPESNSNWHVYYQLVTDKFIDDLIDCRDKNGNIDYTKRFVYVKFVEEGDEITEIRILSSFNNSWTKNSSGDIEHVDVNITTEAFNEALGHIQGKSNTSGLITITDPTDIYTSPLTSAGSSSIFDFFESFIHYLSIYMYGSKYNVRRSLWSKSFTFINSKTFVSLFYYRFCGRDFETLDIVNSDDYNDITRTRFNIFRSDINEIDIWEINTSPKKYTASFSPRSGLSATLYVTGNYSDVGGPTIRLGQEMIFPTLISYNRVVASVNFDRAEGLFRVSEEFERVENFYNTVSNSMRAKSFLLHNVRLKFNVSNSTFSTSDKVIRNFKYFVNDTGATRTVGLNKDVSIREFFNFCRIFFGSNRNPLEISASKSYGTFWKAYAFISRGRYYARNTDSIINKLNVEMSYLPQQIIYHSMFSDIMDSLLVTDFDEFTNRYISSSMSSSDKLSYYETIILLTKSFIQYIVLVVRTGLHTIMRLMHSIASFGGKNGSIYISANPKIDIGDEIILWKYGGDEMLRIPHYALTKSIKSNKTPLKKYVDNTIRFISSPQKYLSGGINQGSEGKIFIEDYDDPSTNDYIWYVWKHVIYVGNFGVTSGYTSKVYITNEPMDFGVQFLDDTVIARQLANYLFESGLGGQYPQEIRRLLGV